MSIFRQTLSAVIVTFKSDEVINDCIQSIPEDVKIIVIDNSNDKKFKEYLENKYKNVSCILSSENLGMGSGNNLGLKYVETDFAIILNPDVILEKETINEIINEVEKIREFAILAPLSNDRNYPNYKINDKNNTNGLSPFNVQSVDGYAMVINLKRLNQYNDFKENKFFDENFFMYLENDDLCKRLINLNEKIYIIPKARINHLGAKAVNPKFAHEVELSRNWHWIWSKFYFNKKHFGYFKAVLNCFPNFLSAIIKFLIYLILNKKLKREIYLKRISGFLHAFLGKRSSYRPKINN